MDLPALWFEAVKRGMPKEGALLVVEVGRQRLTLLRRGRAEKAYRVSTSKEGTGNVMESFQTPLGWHHVVERYGDGEAIGRVFFEREPTADVLPREAWCADNNRDLILTRILRLAGIEDGVNRGGTVDTYERYIYLHGSNHEHQLGRPASHGCVHMGNEDIVDLFDRLAGLAVWCWIGGDSVINS